MQHKPRPGLHSVSFIRSLSVTNTGKGIKMINCIPKAVKIKFTKKIERKLKCINFVHIEDALAPDDLLLDLSTSKTFVKAYFLLFYFISKCLTNTFLTGLICTSQ